MKRMKSIFPIALVVLILGIVGRMDFDDHVQIERYKCEYHGGSWVIENNGDVQYCK